MVKIIMHTGSEDKFSTSTPLIFLDPKDFLADRRRLGLKGKCKNERWDRMLEARKGA